MKKILTPIIAIIIAIILVFAIGKNLILKAAIEGGVKAATGVHLTLGSINLDIFKTSLQIKDMRLYNPKGYSDKIMCEIPEIFIQPVLGDILKGNIHIKKMTLNLKQLTVEKNADGQTNVNSLKPMKEKGEEKAKPAEKKKEGGPAPKFLIEELNLIVGKVTYKDFTATPSPSIKEYDVDLNENYKNITDPKELVSLILVKALMKTSISRLANLNVSDLQSTLTNVSGESFKTKAEAMATQAAESIKSLF